MSVPGSASPLFLATAAAADAAAYQISRSLRFSSGDSAYLSRTPSSAGNRKTWTWSGWVKRSTLGVQRGIFSSYGSSHPTTGLVFDAADTFTFFNYNGSSYDFQLTSSAVFRDPSAWYHFVIAVDTTQATASNRIKIYVNGEQVTAFGTSSYPSSNFECDWNSATEHNIGKHVNSLDGYLAEVNFLDGTAVSDATDFGEEDSNGVWQPKAFSGTYGTNGFNLKFDDNSSNSALGTDSSGNSNTWTVNNLSVADGAAVTISTATGALPIRNTTGDQGGTAASGFRTDANASNLFLALPLNTNTSDVSNSINSNSTTKSTTNQSTATSSSQSRFYGNSSYWNANSDGILVAQSGSELVVGTGDFTIECWFYDDSNHGGGGSGRCYLFDNRIGGTVVGDPPQLTGYVDGSNTINFGCASTISTSMSTDNKWIHFAAVRSSGTCTLYIDGVSVGTASDTTNYTNNGIGIGRATDANYGWAGYIQDFRVYKTAKYTSNFDIPAEANPTTGAGCDSLIDTPTNYTAASSNNGGNCCTWNPLDLSSGANLTISNGNLDIASDNNNNYSALASFGMSSGKWYWEATCGTIGSYTQASIGINDSHTFNDGYTYYSDNGNKSNNGSTSSYGNSFNTAGTVVGIAFDAGAGTLTFYKNGVSQGVAFTADTTRTYRPFYRGAGSTPFSFNFGQRPFAYTPPTGYVSLCTQNLSESAYASIANGLTVFDVPTWTGDGTSRNITIDGGFSPDLVWVKNRSNSNGRPLLYDAIRGAGANKALVSDGNDTEGSVGDDSTNGYVGSFLSDGFSVNSQRNTNIASDNYVAWCWDAGTASAASNTDGNITSSVKVNQSAGFSIVTYSASTQTSASVGHGLNAVPTFIMAKSRTVQSNWYVWFPVLDNAGKINQTLYLNTTNGKTNVTEAWGHSDQMTTSTFGVHPTSGNATNNGDMVAYVFTPIEGFSAFGSYTGNGSTDGPFVFTGMRPALIMVKRTDTTGNWVMMDSSRDEYNYSRSYLEANTSDVEGTFAGNGFSLVSNGFKLEQTTNSTNTSAGTYVYAAWAEHPFRSARAK